MRNKSTELAAQQPEQHPKSPPPGRLAEAVLSGRKELRERIVQEWGECCQGGDPACHGPGGCLLIQAMNRPEAQAVAAAQQPEPPADPPTVTVRWTCPRPSCGREHEWEWSEEDVPLGGAISRMHCESCPAVTPMVAHRVPGGVRMIEPEPPAARAEVAGWEEVVSVVSRVLGEPTGNGIWANLVLDALRPLWPPTRLEAVRELLAELEGEEATIGTLYVAHRVREAHGLPAKEQP